MIWATPVSVHVDRAACAWRISEIFQGADLGDDGFDAAEAPGLDVICRGPSMVATDDLILTATAPTFDGLYEYQRRVRLLGGGPA